MWFLPPYFKLPLGDTRYTVMDLQPSHNSLGKRRAEFTPEGDDESYKQPRTDLTVSQAPTNWSPVNPDTRLYGDYTNPTMWRPEIAQHPHGQPYTEGAGPEWVQYPYVDQFGSVADAQLQNSFQGLTLPKNTSHPQHLCQYQQAVRQEDGSEYIGQTNYPKYACYYVAEADVGLFPPGTIVRTYGTDLPYYDGPISAECGLKAGAWVQTKYPVRSSDLPGDQPIAVYEHKVDAARVRALDESRSKLERQRAIESQWKWKQENPQGSIKEEPGSQNRVLPPPVFDAASQQWRSQPAVPSFIGSENAFSYGGQVTSLRSDASLPQSCGCLFGPCEYQQ